MPGAVYGRTSQETDDAYSVSSQIDACLDYAKLHKIDVPSEYVFREDYTGKAFDRPEYTKIRTLIKARAIDCLVVYATDRLARKVSVGEIFLDEMIENGVSLHLVSWGQAIRTTPEDKLRFNFETTFSSFERDKIFERTMRGKIKKASMGGLVGNMRPPFGYSLNQYKNNFVVNEYASYVRQILILYGIEQLKPVDIAKKMQLLGVPTPGYLQYVHLMEVYRFKLDSGRISKEEYDRKEQTARRQLRQNRWTANNIYPILDNAYTYAGEHTFVMNRQTFTITVPPIITKEEAEAVKRMLSIGRSKHYRKEHTAYQFLMARRLRCGVCGYSFRMAYNQKKYEYYMCGSKRGRNTVVCTNKGVIRPIIDDLTKVFVRELLLSPERLFAYWSRQREEEAKANEGVLAEIEMLEKRIDQTRDKLNRTLDRLTDKLDDDEKAYYIQQKEDLKKLLAEYREERDARQQRLVKPDVSEELIEDFASLGREYKDVLETSEDFTFWRGLVDDLDVTGIVGADEQGRYIDFVIFGQTRKRDYFTRNKENDETGGNTEKSRPGVRLGLPAPAAPRTDYQAHPRRLQRRHRGRNAPCLARAGDKPPARLLHPTAGHPGRVSKTGRGPLLL